MVLQMMTESETPKSLTFHISHDIYPMDCLVQAIRDFDHFCRVVTRSNEAHSIIDVLPNNNSAHAPDKIAAEFLNYLLILSYRSQVSPPPGKKQQ
jgi:hypothetical protein